MVYNNTLTPSVTSIQVTSLTPYHNYKCSVAAYARGGLGPFSAATAWLTDHGEDGICMHAVVYTDAMIDGMPF